MNNFFPTASFWNPLELVTSPVKSKPNSNLTLEEKVENLEENINDLQNKFPNLDDCKDIFFQRITMLINENIGENETFLREFYQESPDYMINSDFVSMFKTLNWLSLSDVSKKKMLDDELDDYFNSK